MYGYIYIYKFYCIHIFLPILLVNLPFVWSCAICALMNILFISLLGKDYVIHIKHNELLILSKFTIEWKPYTSFKITQDEAAYWYDANNVSIDILISCFMLYPLNWLWKLFSIVWRSIIQYVWHRWRCYFNQSLLDKIWHPWREKTKIFYLISFDNQIFQLCVHGSIFTFCCGWLLWDLLYWYNEISPRPASIYMSWKY